MITIIPQHIAALIDPNVAFTHNMHKNSWKNKYNSSITS